MSAEYDPVMFQVDTASPAVAVILGGGRALVWQDSMDVPDPGVLVTSGGHRLTPVERVVAVARLRAIADAIEGQGRLL